jgi:hypothetical protein
MPVRTRASAPANRIYSSPAAQEQVKFKPRRKLVIYRHSTGGIRPSRQSTLTQIDFVNLQDFEDDNDEIDDEEAPKRKKRRRTEEYERTSTSKYHTQTLTQLEFVSTPAITADDLRGDDEDLYGADEDIKPEPNSQPGNVNISQPRVMGPLRTPRRPRIYEVPSSQSPASPASNRSRRSLHTRSPLKVIDGNVQVVSSPTHKASQRKSIKAKIADSDGFVEESQQDTLQQTPIANRGRRSSDQHFISNPREWIEEIQDSDEEAEEQDTYQDDFKPEAQIEITLIKSPDTQEAENQLQSNILQFTQLEPCFTEHVSATEAVECLSPRPSQATTVSLSQSQSQPRSSPIKSSIKSEEPESPTVDEYETMVPESPSNQVSATQSQSPYQSIAVPRLRNNPQHETSINTSDPPVPFSIGSSQLLTRSQMLPESLMQDSVLPPPLFIEDSDLDE